MQRRSFLGSLAVLPGLGFLEETKQESNIEGIVMSPTCAYVYAEEVIKGRWVEGESIIATDPMLAVRYAMNIIDGRLEEAEDVISKSPHAAYLYAKNVIKGRWEVGEDAIGSDYRMCEFYCENVLDYRKLSIEERDNLEREESKRLGRKLDHSERWSLSLAPEMRQHGEAAFEKYKKDIESNGHEVHPSNAPFKDAKYGWSSSSAKDNQIDLDGYCDCSGMGEHIDLG